MSGKTVLPRDRTGAPIDALRFKDSLCHTVAIGAGSLRNSTAFLPETQVVQITATVDCYIQQGDVTVVATSASHLIAANVAYRVSIRDLKYIAVIHVSGSGSLFISEME